MRIICRWALWGVSFMVAASLGCHGHHETHQHGHGHQDSPKVTATLWSDTFEVFVEHASAVAGQPVRVFVHITTLSEFRPLEKGILQVEFEGPEPIQLETGGPVSPGIFEVQMTPKKSGRYRGEIRVRGPFSGLIQGMELQVYETEQEAMAQHSNPRGHEFIEFSKEQQWSVPFGTSFAGERFVAPSVVVSGRIETPPGGSAVVGAPIAGRLVSPATGLPKPGAMLKRGQVLAFLSPAPTSPEAGSRVRLGLTKAEAKVTATGRALERAERLIKDEAISLRELEEARREKAVALEALVAARRNAKLYLGAREAKGAGTWQLTAPIAGALTEVLATPGASVAPGQALFRMVDTRELWIVARIPEQDVPHLRLDRDIAFRVAGIDAWTPIALAGDDSTGSLVTLGRVVDPVSRTVDAIYSLNGSDPSLRIGGLVQVTIPVGEAVQGVAVPREALIDQDGRAVVYVQVDGEHFEERLVRRGGQAGDWVAIVEGLRGGERIVTRGNHLVRLAGRVSTDAPHGHVH